MPQRCPPVIPRERSSDHPQQQVLSGEERLVPTELALYGAIGSIVVKEVRTTDDDDDDELQRERAHTAHADVVSGGGVGGPPQILYQVTMVAARRANSSLLKANAWHHRSDALSSVIALLGIAAAQAGQSPYWDPVAAAVVSAMIVRTTAHANTHDTTRHTLTIWCVRSAGANGVGHGAAERGRIDRRGQGQRGGRGGRALPGPPRARRAGLQRDARAAARSLQRRRVRIALADPEASLDQALAVKDKVRSELLHHMPQLREVVIELSSPTPHHHRRHSAANEKKASDEQFSR